MSVTYTFNYDYAPESYQTSSNQTLGNLLTTFDDEGANNFIGHVDNNRGGFYTDGSATYLTGDTYAGKSTSDGAGYSYSIYAGEDQSLNYTTTGHLLTGTIESITLGFGLTETGEVEYEMLTLTFDDPIVGTSDESYANDVHDIVWGLMNSSTTGASSPYSSTNGGLQNYLESIGINLDATGIFDQSGSGTLATTSTASLFGEAVSLAA